jgi:hypothetical protein
MTRKVKVALFDKDLRVEFKKFPLTSDGLKIDITQGGKAHFKPKIGPTHSLDIPKRKKYLFFGEWVYEPTYFAMKWSKKVIDFKTPEVTGPDPAEVMRAAGNKILESKGKQKTEVPIIMYFIVLILLAIAVKIFGVM